jgi:hypothetical protein
MRHALTLSLATLSLLTACGKGKAPAQPRPEPQPVMRAVTQGEFVLADNAPIFADSTRLIIRDSTEWKKLWQRATSLQHSRLPLPAVDFSRAMIVLAAAGRLKPGDVIHIDSLGVKGSLTLIAVRTTVGCPNLSSDAFPFEIARLPRIDGPIQFVEHRLRAPECQ